MAVLGLEHWILVSAPMGWAENIASQFVNERDVGGQSISYKPGAVFHARKKHGGGSCHGEQDTALGDAPFTHNPFAGLKDLLKGS